MFHCFITLENPSHQNPILVIGSDIRVDYIRNNTSNVSVCGHLIRMQAEFLVRKTETFSSPPPMHTVRCAPQPQQGADPPGSSIQPPEERGGDLIPGCKAHTRTLKARCRREQ